MPTPDFQASDAKLIPFVARSNNLQAFQLIRNLEERCDLCAYKGFAIMKIREIIMRCFQNSSSLFIRIIELCVVDIDRNWACPEVLQYGAEVLVTTWTFNEVCSSIPVTGTSFICKPCSNLVSRNWAGKFVM